MQEAYLSGDPYLAFAKFAHAVPPDATKDSHPRERGLFKTTVLGVQYLISAAGLACRLGRTLPEAEALLEHHHHIFAKFWRWSDAACDCAQLYGKLTAVFGWTLRMTAATTMRTVRNYPMQANGAEMLRLACILAANSGVSVVAPVHDAILIEANDTEVEHTVHLAQDAMRRASETVLSGFALRSDVHVIRFPNRFEDERGKAFWNWLMEAQRNIEGSADTRV